MTLPISVNPLQALLHLVNVGFASSRHILILLENLLSVLSSMALLMDFSKSSAHFECGSEVRTEFCPFSKPG